MLKRWAASPRGIRWTIGGGAAVVLGLVITWVLFVPAAGWLARHDVGSVMGSVHETAVDNARGRLLTLGAGLFAAGALVFTARNFTLSREGQVIDRYTKAIEQLGSEKLDVRIGGIYALERVARDSARDHPTVMEVLTAFIREHSHEQWPPADHPASREQERSTRPDVQAALTVVGRRDPARLAERARLGVNGPDFSRLRAEGAAGIPRGGDREHREHRGGYCSELGREDERHGLRGQVTSSSVAPSRGSPMRPRMAMVSARSSRVMCASAGPIGAAGYGRCGLVRSRSRARSRERAGSSAEFAVMGVILPYLGVAVALIPVRRKPRSGHDASEAAGPAAGSR
jgi:hypothetical protein